MYFENRREGKMAAVHSASSSPESRSLLISDKSRLRVWLYWIIVTSAGAYLSQLSGNQLYNFLGVAILLVGQWLILRAQFSNAAWWLAATPLGFLLGALIGGAIGGNVQDWIDGVPGSRLGIDLTGDDPGRTLLGLLGALTVAGLSVGVVLGFFQWLVLRNQAYRAVWWLPASIVGWSALVVLALYSNLAGSFWLGAVTATALVGLGPITPAVHPIDEASRTRWLCRISGVLGFLAILFFGLFLIVALSAFGRCVFCSAGSPLFMLLYISALALGPAALTTGVLALRQLRENRSNKTQRTLAWSGTILGGAVPAVFVVLILIGLVQQSIHY